MRESAAVKRAPTRRRSAARPTAGSDQKDADLSHRYGHGQHNLSAILAMPMILAGAIDQIQMRGCRRFQRARALYQLWRWLRDIVQMFAFASWEQFYDLITGKIAPQLTAPSPDA